MDGICVVEARFDVGKSSLVELYGRYCVTAKSDTLAYLGPLVNQLYIAELCDFTERVWQVYRLHAKKLGPIKPESRDYLIIRMLYVAEATSNAIRMNATWELTPGAMSLLRDRYEQTVRFSWLARNPSEEEWKKYERAMLAKINSIVTNLNPETVKRFETEGGKRAPPWTTQKLTKAQRAQLGAWYDMDLRSMATKRDAFPPITDAPLAKEGLAHLYDAVYAQFSSVAHYDRFSIEMVKPRQNPGGTVSLCMEPHWPGPILVQTAHLDMIQCSEVTQVCFRQNTSIKFESLFVEWLALARQVRSG